MPTTSKVCSECKKPMGFLSKSHNFEDAVVCDPCFHKERTDSIKDYIARYLAGKNFQFHTHVSSIYRDQDIARLLRANHLGLVREYFQKLLEHARKSGSLEDTDTAETIRMCDSVMRFLNDLEKLYKIFHTMELPTDYIEIVSLFSEFVDKRIDNEHQKMVKPLHKRISRKLGKNISKEDVVKELLRRPLKSGHTPELTSTLLAKFNLNHDLLEVERLMNDAREELELDKFRNRLLSYRNS